jgi:hypothetical protein
MPLVKDAQGGAAAGAAPGRSEGLPPTVSGTFTNMSNDQPVQAMAGFGGGSGATDSLNVTSLSADTSQQTLPCPGDGGRNGGGGNERDDGVVAIPRPPAVGVVQALRANKFDPCSAQGKGEMAASP